MDIGYRIIKCNSDENIETVARTWDYSEAEEIFDWAVEKECEMFMNQDVDVYVTYESSNDKLAAIRSSYDGTTQTIFSIEEFEQS